MEIQDPNSKATQKSIFDQEEQKRKGKWDDDIFFGERAFAIMQSLTWDQLMPYWSLVDGIVINMEAPWLKEYKRWLDRTRD